jgi:hypothetical protein
MGFEMDRIRSAEVRLPEHRLGPVLRRAEAGAGEPGAELLEPGRRVVRWLGEGVAGDQPERPPGEHVADGGRTERGHPEGSQ